MSPDLVFAICALEQPVAETFVFGRPLAVTSQSLVLVGVV